MRKHQQTTSKILPRRGKRLAVLAGIGIACLWCSPVRAQDEPEPPKPPNFPRLFKTPTNMNAYEDWVRAVDLVQNNKMADDAMDAGATLTFKRRLLTDPTVQQALLLLHKSLEKPVQSPYLLPDENTPLVELSGFRKLARLLNTEMYVCFADGRVDAAMDALGDGLRFGYRMQSNTLINGLVGVAVEAIVLKGFAAHLDQLSEYQCSHLQRLVEDWLESPSPATLVLTDEKQTSLRLLENKRNDFKGLEQVLNQATSNEEQPNADTQALLNHLKTNPTEFGPAIDRAKTLVAAYFDSVIANLKQPAKERKSIQEIKEKSPGGALCNLIAPMLSNVVDKYDQNQATIRLLGVHAAIRRYKWEHNFLPNSLSDLHIGHLTDDPFTGDTMKYQKNGATYDLYSQGPIQTDENGRPLATRKAVRL